MLYNMFGFETTPDIYHGLFFQMEHYLKVHFNPNENDQGRKGPCFFQRLIALKCLMCQKIHKNI